MIRELFNEDRCIHCGSCIYLRESRLWYLVFIASIIYSVYVNEVWNWLVITIGLLLLGILHNEQRARKVVRDG